MDQLVSFVHGAWARHDAKSLAAIGAVVGVGSHLLYWMHGLRAPQSAQIFWFHVGAFTVTGALSIYAHGSLDGILAASALWWSYVAGVFTSTAIYRIWFHRLSRFPGPRPARVSKLYSLWRARNGDAQDYILEWHQKYGDFYRSGTSGVPLGVETCDE
jgi:tryprostatin B 6-hydroxylase